MTTECTTERLEFERFRRQRVVGRFDGGELGSDGGGLLLRELAQRTGLFRRLSACFRDHRDPQRTQHPVEVLVAARVLGLALGYEDLIDHDTLRQSKLWSLLCGAVGRGRRRASWERLPPGKSTLNRLELTGPALDAGERYKKIVADTARLDALLVDLFLDWHGEQPERIVLDVDATDDQLHGQQEGRFYHGYYRHYCYLPLYITCGEHVLCARLRTAQAEAAEGTVAELERIVRRIRQRWPQAAIVVRGDAGFCRDTLMTWCEQRGVDYVLGLARNSRLLGQIRRQLRQAGKACARTGQAARRFRDFRYRTLKSWGRQRRVVGKAEWLPGQRGANPRFVVTSLSREEVAGRQLYEELYCARGEMENRIKEQQLDLFADRTSTATMRANQLRMYFSVFAGTLLLIMRRYGLAGSPLARAQSGTIRSRILKVAVAVRVTARKVWLRFSSTYPHRELFERIARLLTDRRPRACPG
jgi:hypothetical protein